MQDFWRAKARAKKKGATQFMSVEEWESIKASHSCHWCGMGLHLSFTHTDHVIPLCEGGQNTVENVVMSCANCNLKREWERKTIYQEQHLTERN